MAVSCDDKEEKPDNHIIFDGKKYPINSAWIRYSGTVDIRSNDPAIGATHYFNYMTFSDGVVDPTNQFYIQAVLTD